MSIIDSVFPAKVVSVNVKNPFVAPGIYQKGLQKALNNLAPHLNPQQWTSLIDHKLTLGSDCVDEESYLQAAVELTVCAWFACAFPEYFSYELKLNPPKDVDCTYRLDGMQFNIEVKCANYSKQRKIAANSDFRLHALGRVENYSDMVGELGELFASADEPACLMKSQHMDLKLKDYLCGANEKFAQNIDETHLNILVVGVDDQMDMNQWIGYLHGVKGLFTADSFEPVANYGRVDLVVLSNLYHRHYQALEKYKISDHWDFSKAFNFFIRNPLSKKANVLFDLFAQCLPNETKNVIDYVQSNTGDDFIKYFAIPSYVANKQFIEGIYCFQNDTES